MTIKHVACGDLFTACLTGEWTPVGRGTALMRNPPRAALLIACHLQTAGLINLLVTAHQGLYLHKIFILHNRPGKVVVIAICQIWKLTLRG